MDWQMIVLLAALILSLIKLTSWGRKREKLLDELIKKLLENGIKPSSFINDPVIEKKEKQKEKEK